MDDYIRLGILIAVAIILLIMLFHSKKQPAAVNQSDDEAPKVFSDSKFDFNYDFLLKNEPHIESTQLTLGFNEKTEPQFLSSEDKAVSKAKTAAKTIFKPKSTQEIMDHPDLLTLSIMARNGSHFASYDLLQAISASGMQYGPMNIFHYYQGIGDNKITLFSLASANEPGEFDLNQIGDFSCSGLILFMKISQAPDPHTAFQLMLDVAEQLAEDLDGEVKADPRTPWSSEISSEYQEKIEQAKLIESV